MSTEQTAPMSEEQASAAVREVIAQMDLSELAGNAVRKAVTAQLGAAAKDIAEGVVAELLTPEVIAGMRETAILEAAVALSPGGQGNDTTPATPPPPPAAAAEEEEPKRELRFKTLAAFVEGYVIQTWRREVSERQSEKNFRWCESWFEHGEVVARLQALWAAFEHMRLGETTEMSEFWTGHFGPHMDRILDPQGPFKHCSISLGHSFDLGPLPCRPMPQAVDTEGHYTERPSGLLVPASTGRARPRRVVAFPEA